MDDRAVGGGGGGYSMMTSPDPYAIVRELYGHFLINYGELLTSMNYL